MAVHLSVSSFRRRGYGRGRSFIGVSRRSAASLSSVAASHGRGDGGFRDDLGFYVRSTWEANYARWLKFLEAAGQIKSWAYEPHTFEFPGIKRGSRFYTPDFCVIECSGEKRWHEVKGYMDAKPKTKLKRMARYFPTEKIILIERRQMPAIACKAACLI